MDKSWIQSSNRVSREYFDGVDTFLNFAYEHNDNPDIKCPCNKCVNRYFHSRDTVREHIIVDGFMANYLTWTLHGEGRTPLTNNIMESTFDFVPLDDMVGAIQDGIGHSNFDDEEINEQTTKFLKILGEAETPLFPNCKNITSLSFTVRMLQLKVINGWSNNSFTSLLELLKEAFEVIGVLLPKNFYKANKIATDLGYTYETWDACPNSGMLFRNANKALEKCSLCEASRYKLFEGSSISNGRNCTDKGRKVAAKQIRYFPLKPRLQRLYVSLETSQNMKWHAERRTDINGVMRHPADSPAWKHLDEMYPDFANESRNVRLGLAADGFNPFGNMSNSHSTWPVVLVPYNLPTWLCMKPSSFILSILIDGPQSPGDKIDVYLELLIEELNDLWNNGVLTFDASTKEMFQLHAALLWTINDFPAYANLSGWSTKGRYACPCCNKETRSLRLQKGSKFCYWGHRRWLESGHKFRKDKVAFDGKSDFNEPPKKLSGTELLEQLKDVETIYKKEDVLSRRIRLNLEKETRKRKKRLREDFEEDNHYNWKKKSIFWELPYWEHLLIRHNLDGMHIEKNICDNMLFTLLCDKDKSKDNLNSRLDLQILNIRRPLHPLEGPSGKKLVPPACYMMRKSDRYIPKYSEGSESARWLCFKYFTMCSSKRSYDSRS